LVYKRNFQKGGGTIPQPVNLPPAKIGQVFDVKTKQKVETKQTKGKHKEHKETTNNTSKETKKMKKLKTREGDRHTCEKKKQRPPRRKREGKARHGRVKLKKNSID